MKIRFSKTPTFTKAIIASAVFAIVYLASTSNLPSCSDTVAVLSSGGECIERQSFLHTASGWLALICLVAAVLLLALKHKDSILGRLTPVHQAHQGPSTQDRVPVPTPGRAGVELLRQVRHPHHRGRHVLPGMRSPNGVPVILAEIPADITDLH